MPVGGPDDPQYFDCHERTSGLYPAYLATALCVVLAPLYAALDPQYGGERWRPMPWKEVREKKNQEEQKRMRMQYGNHQVGISANLSEAVRVLVSVIGFKDVHAPNSEGKTASRTNLDATHGRGAPCRRGTD